MRASHSFVRRNGLGLTALALFLLVWLGQSVAGQHAYNAEQEEHRQQTVGYAEYLRSAHFGEATFENWESEFLQMGAYVVLTVWLRQRGSAESKPVDGSDDPVDESPEQHRHDRGAPWPVRRGGTALALYKRSLSITFFALFGASWLLHAVTGAHETSQEELAHGGHAITTLQYVRTGQFWFESFQNWQSELLAVAAIVVLSIFLRQEGSPESKPVHAAHAATGSG